MNENWPRWVFASFSKHFADHFAAAGIPLFVEGDDRDTSLTKDFAEFRMDGPRIRERSRNYFELYVPVNILVTSAMDDANTHRGLRTIGKALSGFADSISVFKYGANNPPDDRSLLVCMVLLKSPLHAVRENHFGQVDKTVRLQQATVEGHYQGYITTE